MRIRPGLHVDGMWGTLSSVAAAAKLLDVPEERYLDALGIAACQIPTSLYEPVRAGKTARNTYAAHAALISVLLAESAAAGIGAPDAAFEQAALHIGSGAKPSSGWAWCEPGEFLVLQGYLKPYASVRHTHYAVEAARQWRAEHGRDTAIIERIVLETYSEAITYCGVRGASTPIQAQFSLSYAIAHALRIGDLGPNAYAAEVLGNDEQRRLESLVELRVDPEMAGRAARLRVQTMQGEHVYFADAVDGDATRPYDEQRVMQKALAYMRDQVGEIAASSIVERILHAPLSAPFSLGAEAPR
jgi:2-methylcitrate dehydratase PrpD